MVAFKPSGVLLALALGALAVNSSSRAENAPPSPRMNVSCQWRQDASGNYTIAVKLKNFEDYDVSVNQVSLDNYWWYSIGRVAPAAGILEFTLAAKKEPVVVYVQTAKYGTLRFPLDQPLGR